MDTVRSLEKARVQQGDVARCMQCDWRNDEDDSSQRRAALAAIAIMVSRYCVLNDEDDSSD